MNINHSDAGRSENDWLDVFGPHVKFLTGNHGGGDDYVVIRSLVEPGVIVPLHSHEDRETMIVLSGEADAYVNGQWVSLAQGSHIDIGSHVPHAWRNISNVPAEILVVTTEKIERFFREIGRDPSSVVGPPAPEELAKLFETSARYGYWVGSPEENAAIGLHLQMPA